MLGSLYDFAKGMGKKLFTTDAEAGLNILQHLEANNPGVKPIDVKYDDGVVTLSGVAKTAVAKEKAILMAGNVEGVEKVIADDVEVDEPIPTAGAAATAGTAANAEVSSAASTSTVSGAGGASAATEFSGVLPGTRYYEIQKGDTLYAIAKEFYGNGMKYPEIFEANREVIEDPDKIYPGQKIRLPALEG